MTGPVTTVHQPNVMQVTLHCDVAHVRPAVQMAHDFLAKQGWQENDLMSFDLALVEACNNAIKYAGESGRQRPVVLEAICQPAQVEFRVHDHTPGFAWPKQIALPEPESESGRGLYLINSLSDYAGYFRGQDGNVLVMRKNRRQSAGNSVAAKISGSGATVRNENERIINDLVEELSSCYESLSAIFRYSADHGGSALPEIKQLLGDVPAV
jgi:anti-sigma regulatory factor (Ser/Thr protein kinase)